MGQFCRLGTHGYCTNSANMLNLLKTGAYAEQSSFNAVNGASAVLACDGDVIVIDTGNPPPNYNWVLTKLLVSSDSGTPSTP